MKQIALSLFVIASSGAYVWDQAGTSPAGDVIDTSGPASAAEAPPVLPPAIVTPPLRSATIEQQSAQIEPPPAPAVTVIRKTTVAIAAPVSDPQIAAPIEWAPAALIVNTAPAKSITIKPVSYIPIPKPKPNQRQAPARAVKTGMKSSADSRIEPTAYGFVDGAYTGPVTDAYYGLIQIQALIRGGRLTALKVLKFPSDRRTSIFINRQALPMLRDEAIAAQSADVDIISGATLTSRAFIQSLGGALKKASS